MKYFEDHWLNTIHVHQKKLLPVPLIRTKRHWFKYYENKVNPKASKFGCRICEEARKFITYREIDSGLKSLATPGGVLGTSLSENTKLIQRHEGTNEHKRAVETLEKMEISTLSEKFSELDQDAFLEEAHKSTRNVLDAAYYSTTVHNSLESFKKTINFMSKKGVDMGEEHCQNTVSYKIFV